MDRRRRRSARKRCPAHCAGSAGWASTCWRRPAGRGKQRLPPMCAGDWRCVTGWAGRPQTASQTGRSPWPSQRTEACSWRSRAALAPWTNWTWSNLGQRRKTSNSQRNQSNWFPCDECFTLSLLFEDTPCVIKESSSEVKQPIPPCLKQTGNNQVSYSTCNIMRANWATGALANVRNDPLWLASTK